MRACSWRCWSVTGIARWRGGRKPGVGSDASEYVDLVIFGHHDAGYGRLRADPRAPG
jgi:hypothetical protein